MSKWNGFYDINAIQCGLGTGIVSYLAANKLFGIGPIPSAVIGSAVFVGSALPIKNIFLSSITAPVIDNVNYMSQNNSQVTVDKSLSATETQDLNSDSSYGY